MKKNIAVFVKNLTSGGAEKQAVLLAKALAGDYKMHYIIFNGRKVHKKYLKLLHEDARVHVVSFQGGHLSRFCQFVSYLKANDIYMIFSYLTAANLYACMAGRITGTKVVTGLRNAELPIGKRIADRILANHCAVMAVVNCFSGNQKFVSQGFRKEKLIVIPNCFENISPYTEKQDTDGKIHIITVGRFVTQKDYPTAIKAVSIAHRECANLWFDIVGYGEQELVIRDLVETYGIDGCTTIHINPDNIQKLLQQSSVYLSTSLFEGTSNSIMEGMNANMPVIATDVGDNYKLVRDRVNGYLETAGDADSIAKDIITLYRDADLRNRMAMAGKKNLEDNYSVEIFRKRYIELIEIKGKRGEDIVNADVASQGYEATKAETGRDIEIS